MVRPGIEPRSPGSLSNTLPTRINEPVTNNNDNDDNNKTTIWTVQVTNQRNLARETWTWPRKGSIERETESLLIAAQNNALRSKYVKAKIVKIQQNSR